MTPTSVLFAYRSPATFFINFFFLLEPSFPQPKFLTECTAAPSPFFRLPRVSPALHFTMSDAAKPTEEPKVAAATEEAAPAPTEVTEAPKAEQTENKQPSNILKTKARIDLDDHRNNRKFDPSSREVTSDPVAIRKQVREFALWGVYDLKWTKKLT